MRIRKSFGMAALTLLGAAALSLAAIACSDDDDNGDTTGAAPTATMVSGGPATGGAAPTEEPEASGPAVDGVAVCPQMGVTQLEGAGATFPFPLFSAMFDEYEALCNVQVNYQSIGSGGGITQVQGWTVDFGASEGIMTEEQREDANPEGGNVLHIPVTIGPVAVIYNLDGIGHEELLLTPDVLSDIYLKNITNWNDDRIQAINPDLDLPEQDIAVVHRSDGSGTTFVFTSYLDKVSEEWSERVGYATSVNWIGDIGGPGNEGVSQQVQQIPGAIGYVSSAYAIQTDLPWAQIQNQAGNWQVPSVESSAAAASLAVLPDNMEVLFTDTDNPDGYPIAGFAWLLVYENQQDEAVADAVARLAWWMLSPEAQTIGDPLNYVPVEGDALEKAKELVRQITFNGQSVLD